MLQNFTKYAGLAQMAIGLLGQFVSPIGSLLGVPTEAGAGDILGGGNLFNVISGAALSYLGFKGTESTQRTGAQVLGGLNGVVGLLGAFGLNNLGGLQLTNGWGAIIINLIVGAWGLYSAYAKKSAGAAAR